MSYDGQDEVQRQAVELLNKGYIRLSASPNSAPCLLVAKKSGERRLGRDYRHLDAITKRKRTSPPRIDDILHDLRRATVFSKIDLRSGYWQVRVAPDPIEKTAFDSPVGLHGWLVMRFDLTNAPATFVRLLNYVFLNVLCKFVVIYIDDILVFSNSLEEHRRHLQIVLDCLRQHRLFAKLSKCMFAVPEVEYVGHLVGSGQRRPDPGKTEAIVKWPPPGNVRGVREFVGTTGYLRDSIRDDSLVAAPLTDLLKKDVQFRWEREQPADSNNA